jgi:hypothetical protein
MWIDDGLSLDSAYWQYKTSGSWLERPLKSWSLTIVGVLVLSVRNATRLLDGDYAGALEREIAIGAPDFADAMMLDQHEAGPIDVRELVSPQALQFPTRGQRLERHEFTGGICGSNSACRQSPTSKIHARGADGVRGQ